MPPVNPTTPTRHSARHLAPLTAVAAAALILLVGVGPAPAAAGTAPGPTVSAAGTGVGAHDLTDTTVVEPSDDVAAGQRRDNRLVTAVTAVGSRVAPNTIRGIKTPHGVASQGTDAASLAARAEVEGGARVWRLGTTGKSQAGEAQFWSLEHPSTPGFADRYGIPPGNVANADFIESGVVQSPFVTRPAPGVGTHGGGGIEAVVPQGGVRLCGFSYLGPKGC